MPWLLPYGTSPEDEIGALAYMSKENGYTGHPAADQGYSRWRSPNGGVSHRSRLHCPCRFALCAQLELNFHAVAENKDIY